MKNQMRFPWLAVLLSLILWGIIGLGIAYAHVQHLPPVTLQAEPGQTTAWSQPFPKRDRIMESVYINGQFQVSLGGNIQRWMQSWTATSSGVTYTLALSGWNHHKNIVVVYVTGNSDQTVTVRVKVWR